MAGTVSVCMATYNGEKFISSQLCSILCQLDKTDEVVISDDNSSDDTINIIKSFKDERIRIIENQSRRGPACNFETALSHSANQYIILSDQDDVWLPHKVMILVKLLNAHDLVVHDCDVIDMLGNKLHDSFFALRGSQVGFWNNILKNSYIGCCMAFKREILLYALPFPNTIHMHDWWIGLLAERKFSTYLCEEKLIHYVRHGNNASPTGERGYGLLRKISNRLIMLWHVCIRLYT